MSALWTNKDAGAATGGTCRFAFQATGVSIDSRTVAAGDLFIALAGPNHDGHDHVEAAFAAGASAAMIHREMDANGALIRVNDTLIGMADLARHRRAQSSARVAGITGSVGKTGTKEILHQLLADQATTHASAKSHNNHWGVPLTLARLPLAAKYAVVEMGMNAPGEIRALTKIAQPHVALITEVAAAHLKFFNSVAEIAAAKAEIFEGVVPGGMGIIPADNPHAPVLRQQAEKCGVKLLSFGMANDADWRILDLQSDAQGSDVHLAFDGLDGRFRVGVPGAHWARNAVAALAVVSQLGGDVEAAATKLETVQLSGGRGGRQMLDLGGKRCLLIDESYNANPASMRAALAMFADLTMPKIAVLGDMLELGATAPQLHADLKEDVLAAGLDRLILVGPQMANLAEALGQTGTIDIHRAADEVAAGALLGKLLKDGDGLLIKGSNGIGLSRIVHELSKQSKGAAA